MNLQPPDHEDPRDEGEKMDEFDAWKAERNRALAELDLSYARKMMPQASNPAVYEIAMHKARYDCTDVAAELRHTSAAWLRERGYGGFSGPLLPEGGLPK